MQSKVRLIVVIAKLLVVIMIAQGLPLQRVSREHVWKFDSENTARILSLIGPAGAEASESGTLTVDPLVFDSGELSINAWHLHYSQHKFTVTNPGPAILAVTTTAMDKEVRDGCIFFNREFIPLHSFFNSPDQTFEKKIDLGKSNCLNVLLRGEPGASVTITIKWADSPDPPPSVTFTADPLSISMGDISTLTWQTSNADTVSIDNNIGAVDLNGEMSVSPTTTTQYRILATGPGGRADAEVTVRVNDPTPTVTITATPPTIAQGESATLEWTSSGATSCTIEPDIGAVDPNGSISVSPEATTIYTITATGSGGAATAQVSVTVVASGPPTVTFDPANSTIAQGESVTLSWTSVRATAAHIDNGVGVVATSGSVTVTPENTTVYTLTVSGPGGSASAGANVYVTGTPSPQPDGSFGDQYDDLIPADSTVSDYDPFRFAVITGLIQDTSGASLEDVLVSIHDHPEYGTARTDMAGRFSLPVEGGDAITIECRKDGYIDAHRKINVPWNDIAACPTIVMLVQDTASSEIVLDGSAGSILTHKSTITADGDGSRSCTMVFSGDTNAYLTDENGNDVHRLQTISVRATEHTTPEAMPAELPPNSGFTYCTELNADGADRVRFSDPVITWVDNFLNIDVGTAVPAGYYDRDKGVWVPSQNGIVVQLLDMDHDGIVDALDADGDGQPDDLNSDGQTADEVKGLSDASSYPPGSTFWRIPITHFSPWDFNFPVSAPTDAVSPNPNMAATVNFKDGRFDCSTRVINSYVKDRSCVYHEDIAIPGTDMTLHYTSKRTPGYRVTSMVVPASGDEVPASLKRIEVSLQVGGLVMVKQVDPLPNQFVEFEWDGKDVYGNDAYTTSFLRIGVGYVYQANYGMPSEGSQSFGQSPMEVMAVPSRDEIILWRHEKVSLHLTNGTIADGWTLSDHHHLNPADKTVLHKGDGTLLKQQAKIVKTYAGNKASSDGGWGDGGPALDAFLDLPNDAVYDAEGNLYIGTVSRIRKVDPEGIISTLAGGGTSTADGISALDADIHVGGLAVDPDGIVYGIDLDTCRVRKIDPNGIITTVAGNGTCGFGGDGGPAVEASFATTLGLASDPNGNLYIADTHNHRVRKVDPNGIITTIAGTGDDWTDPLGGYARQTAIENPVDVAVGADGDLFICNKNANSICKVDNSGIITTYAGTGLRGYGGDGGPAVEAHLWYPHGLSMDSVGNLYIADSWWGIVRKVDTNGIIDTVAGNQTTSYDDSGLPAISTGLPYGTLFVAADESDNFYIGGGDRRVLRVGIPALFRSLADVNDLVFADNNGLVYTVSQDGLHRATFDMHTGVAIRRFEYDTENNLTGIVDQFGNRITIECDSSGRATAILSADGIRTDITIDTNNHVTQVRYADGAHYNFEYTSSGLMTAEIDPKGNRFEHAYDSAGLITDVEDPELGHWQYTRATLAEGIIETVVTTAEGNTTTYRDSLVATDSSTYTKIKPNGDEITFTRTDDNLSLTKEMPCGMTINYGYSVDTQYQYEYQRSSLESTPGRLNRSYHIEKEYHDTDNDDAIDRITIAATLNEKTATTTQDLLTAQLSTTSPEGRTTVMDYDPANLLTTAVKIPGLNETTFGYNSQGRLTSLNQGTRGLSMTYDSSGNMDSLTLAGVQTYSYDHDAVGRVTSVQRPDGSTTAFGYDANGNLELLTTPSLVSHRFVYNGVDNPDSYQTPLSGDYVYSYDRDRQLTDITFPSGRHIANSYTTTQLSHVQMPHADLDITYLAGNRIDAMTMGAESLRYGYDGQLVTSETASGTLSHTTNYDYNNDFNIASITYAGTTSAFTYDNDGLITGSGPFTISRNADNGLAEGISDGTLHIAQSFNGYAEIDGQTTAVGSRDLLSWSLVRDDLGRISEKTETVDGETITYVYAYDSLNRLTSVTRNGDLVESYTYAAAGTRATETNTLRGITNRTFDYSDEEHLLTADGVSYTYDLDGFLSGKTDGTDSTSYTYSVQGELLQVTLSDGTVVEYIHDPMGRRIAKQVNGSIVEKYLWSSQTTLLAVYDGSNHLIQRFEYAGGRLPSTLLQAGATYYLAYDQVGSLRVVSDSAGNVVKRIDYDAFGNIIHDTNTAFNIPFGYAGGLHDRTIGLVRFGYRDYDPDTGRWAAKDPIFFNGGDTDLYGYVQNNPVNRIDPYGLIDWVKFWKYTNSVSGPYLSKFMRVGNRIESAAIDGVLGKLGVPTSGIAGFEYGGPILGAIIYTLTPSDLSDPYLGDDGKWYWPDGTPMSPPEKGDPCP